MPRSNETKKKRQNAIVEIIKSENMVSQKDIIQALKERGFDKVTQSIISKDFKELNIIKSDQGVYVFGKQHITKVNQTLLPFVLKHHVTDYGKIPAHPIFIKTSENAEAMIGKLLSNKYPEDIIGFVTNSNFLVIYPSSVDSRKKLLKEIDKLKKTKKRKTTATE
ncbi:arginine repressor [Anoxybacillus voinovskiensis]|uniref:Arginine repressor n=1 Tax=Anoxybacteroides voinovskiense TaxID=230470 RepID=A0A840E022_9BACL|nr:hypothetical protein [Anoxybacillus voinovskiensis]MBB4075089.1 arginine repressor [Anoxybacillus voinovskiensis]GGJ76735.1 hypothetical protein GCM10008982_27560 [Anoxybacillus voinovskiensis]